MLEVASPPVREVADVGAGTGALTRALVAAGLTVTAFEPDAAMLGELGLALPDVVRHQCYAESLPIPDRCVDAVTVGQAWHWFDHAAAEREFARVLRPGGVVGLIWNLRDDTVPWMQELSDLIDGEDTMRGNASDPAEHPRFGTLFSPVERAEFPHSVEHDADSLVGLISTFSYVRLRDDADEVYAAVRELVATHPDLRDRPRFELPYVTATYRAVRLDRAARDAKRVRALPLPALSHRRAAFRRSSRTRGAGPAA